MMKIVASSVTMRSHDTVGSKHMEHIGFSWGHVNCWYFGIFPDDEYLNKRKPGKEFSHKNIKTPRIFWGFLFTACLLLSSVN